MINALAINQDNVMVSGGDNGKILIKISYN